MMKHVKKLGLAAAAAMALMALVGVGTASAGGVLCSTATNPCTSKWPVITALDFSLQSGTSSHIEDTSGNTLMTCKEATIKGNLTANPDAEGEATVENTAIIWGSCIATTDTTQLGKLRFKAENDEGDGILISDAETRWTTSIFGSCEYGYTKGTELGTWDEQTQTLTINAILTRLNACLGPKTSIWHATYVKTEPSSTTLFVSTS
jgi:hypothetical protein